MATTGLTPTVIFVDHLCGALGVTSHTDLLALTLELKTGDTTYLTVEDHNEARRLLSGVSKVSIETPWLLTPTGIALVCLQNQDRGRRFLRWLFACFDWIQREKDVQASQHPTASHVGVKPTSMDLFDNHEPTHNKQSSSSNEGDTLGTSDTKERYAEKCDHLDFLIYQTLRSGRLFRGLYEASFHRPRMTQVEWMMAFGELPKYLDNFASNIIAAIDGDVRLMARLLEHVKAFPFEIMQQRYILVAKLEHIEAKGGLDTTEITWKVKRCPKNIHA